MSRCRRLRWLPGPLLLCTVSSAAVSSAAAQVLFSDVTGSSGLRPYAMAAGMTGGVAAADFDADGDVDVFLPTASGSPNQLYRNLGNGTFEETAAALGLASSQRFRGALWFDYDADSRLDLLLTTDCFEIDCDTGTSLLRLYRQSETGSFLEVTVPSGLHDADSDHSPSEHRGGAAVADIDNDGYPDLVVGMWVSGARVFLNRGGIFTDVTATCGLAGPDVGHWQPLLHDFTGDGWMDFFWAVDFFDNQLWINQGVGVHGPTFVDMAAAAGVNRAWNEMGATIGDYDNDGDGDLYVTAIFVHWDGEQRHNTFYRNDPAGGSPRFTEISNILAVRNGGWGWGTTFFDADNDGHLDLAETNGTFLPDQVYKVPIRLYVNDGGTPPRFEDVAAEAGLEDDRWGSGLVAFDYDRDGDLDLMQTVNEGAAVLYQNQHAAFGTGRHHLVIRPRMSGPNTHAIGARITLQVGATTQTRWITAGTSMGSQEPAEAHFGMGPATVADRVTVHWPGGGQSVLVDVAADQVMTVMDDRLFADGFESGAWSAWSNVSSP